MKKLIIFDLDGVLLDSEPLYMAMNQGFFAELGVEISDAEYQTFIGIAADKMWGYIKEKGNLPQPVQKLKELEKELKFNTLSEAALEPTPGVTDFLKYLKQQGYTLAIASSGLRKNITLILEKLRLAAFFDLVVSGDEVINGKPAPDIFLKVANHFRLAPEQCVVIEDSTNGVLAAKRANMHCLGFRNLNSGNQDLSRADRIFDHFTDPNLRALFPTLQPS